MKGFLIGLILGGIGGIVGGYFSFRKVELVKQLREQNDKLLKQEAEAKARMGEAERKYSEAVEREKAASENHELDLKKQADEHQAQLRRLQGDIETAKGDAENLRKEMARVKEEARNAIAASGSVPVMAKLLKLRDGHRPVEVAVARDLVEARMLLSRAKENIPVAKDLRAVADALKEKTASLTASANELQSHISRNSTALKEAGVDTVAQMQDLSNQEAKLVQSAVDAVVDAVLGIRSAKAEIQADKMEWQGTDISALKGDYLYVSGLRKSKWSMRREFGPKSGADAIGGWDQHYEAKILPEARAGGLIMRVGLSEEVRPAYERRPVVAEAIGTLAFRMNDRLAEGNWGKAYIEITAVPGGRLEEALAAIEGALKQVAWLKW